jgi:hypothetical protein
MMKSKILHTTKILGTYILFSFLFFGMWEWIQTPFYSEPHKTLNQVVLDRIHCTGGDILIFLTSILISSLLVRKNLFFSNIVKKEIVLISCIGTGYTALSEYLNVFVHQSWAYSTLMPLFPFINIGIIPLIQWMILPSIILYFVKTHIRKSNKGDHYE